MKGDRMKSLKFALLMSALTVFTFTASGCGEGASTTVETTTTKIHKEGDRHEHTDARVVDDHSGWWCNEHGVPEKVCALCSSKVAADFQKKGDWCKEHDRPDSQCFKCHPELEAKFAAQYEAKYGKQPPTPEG